MDSNRMKTLLPRLTRLRALLALPQKAWAFLLFAKERPRLAVQRLRSFLDSLRSTVLALFQRVRDFFGSRKQQPPPPGPNKSRKKRKKVDG